MPITITSEKLRNLIKETLKEVITLEFMKLRADLMPFVSPQEQKEIEKLYGKPTRKFVKSLKVKI